MTRMTRAQKKKVWRLLKNTEAAKEFGVYYYRLASDDEYAVKQDTSGSTGSLPQAFRLAAGHCAAAELLPGEYAKAVVFNRWKGHLIRTYVLRPGEQIQIKDL
jgi:hypothetical protein